MAAANPLEVNPLATINPMTLVTDINLLLPNTDNQITAGTVVSAGAGSNMNSFVKQDGSVSHNEWVKTASGWMHSNEHGFLDKGWNQVNNKWYYFEEGATNTNVMHTGWLSNNYGGQLNFYFMSGSGEMFTGYQVIDGKTYYFDPVGSNGRPAGSLAVNFVTPDGRVAGADGVVR